MMRMLYHNTHTLRSSHATNYDSEFSTASLTVSKPSSLTLPKLPANLFDCKDDVFYLEGPRAITGATTPIHGFICHHLVATGSR